MSKSKEEFLSGSLRIAAIQFAQRSGDTARVPGILEEGGFNVEQLLHAVASQGFGLYDEASHGEMLRQYIADSANRGIGIILYENAHMMTPETLDAHPDWAQIGPDGKPSPAYGSYTFACVNTPWREEFFRHIRQALKLDIRGIFLDGPIFTAPGCRCEHCRELFLQRFGHPFEQASRRELQSFKSEHIGRFVRDVRQIIDESGRDVALYANCLGMMENVTGCTVDTVFPYVDLLGTEGGFLFYGNPSEVSIWHGSESAKYLESKAEGKPFVIFNAGNDQPWARQMQPPAETTLLYSSTVANGGNVWYGIHGLIDGLNTPSGKASFAFNRFLKQQENCFAGTEQYAETALFWSQRTADCFPGNVAETDFTRGEKREGSASFGSYQKEFHVKVKSAGQVAELVCVDLLCLQNKFLRVIPRGDVQVGADLPVKRVFHHHVKYRAAVVHNRIKFIQHLIHPVAAGDAFQMVVFRRPFQRIAPLSCKNLPAVCAQDRHIGNDDLARNAKMCRQPGCRNAPVRLRKKPHNLFSSFQLIHCKRPFLSRGARRRVFAQNAQKLLRGQ